VYQVDLQGLIIQLIAGTIIGFTIGLTGIGGGVLVMPTLTILLGMPPSIAVGTASFYSLLTKVYAVFEHKKIDNIDFNLSWKFLLGAVPANLAVSLIISQLAVNLARNVEGLQRFQDVLALVIGIVLIGAVVSIVLPLVRPKRITLEQSQEGEDSISSESKIPLVQPVSFGLLVGSLIGATSVGGGVIIVPILLSVFKLSTSKTVGTSIFIGVVLVFVTSIVYGSSGQLSWQTGLIMAFGSVAGVYIGARLTKKVPETAMKVVLAGLVLFAAGAMIFR
jgi:uncharacterized membrane protein YfcA